MKLRDIKTVGNAYGYTRFPHTGHITLICWNQCLECIFERMKCDAERDGGYLRDASEK